MSRLARLAKQSVRTTFNRLGYELVPTAKRPFGWDRFFSVIRRLGFAPKHVVDVGANKGAWTRTAMEFFPDTQYTLVEPQEELKVYVRDLMDRGRKIRWITAGVADKPGRLPFTIRPRDDSSSFTLSGEQARAHGCQQATVDVTTLNEIVSSMDAPMPEMVKIDAEGFDLKVLSGATKLLGKTDIFLVEMNLVGGWDNSMLATMERLANHGYHPVDITDLNRSPKNGVLFLVEMAFLRNDCRLLEGIAYE